jgi:hypothetical protein
VSVRFSEDVQSSGCDCTASYEVEQLSVCTQRRFLRRASQPGEALLNDNDTAGRAGEMNYCSPKGKNSRKMKVMTKVIRNPER